MSTYDSLHRQCRTLESLFDTKLTSYARLASAVTRGQDDLEATGSAERWKDLEAEVDELLDKLRELNDQLSTLSHDTDNPPSQSMLRAIQRHSEVYQDYARELRRTKTNVQSALDQANLLSGVRNDIDAYKSSAADALLSERGHIDDSHRMTDDILAQAYETRSEFSRQRLTLSGIQTRMSGVLHTMPGMNNLIAMVKTRRRRDAIIVGCIVGVCFIFLLMYIF
ncbi:V-snare-domain-containing protein [Laetiporus sulphureus 93-53]|uniref:Golgi SNAP receptor complex member 1 n=1 Tax=Laetiporus sulphureus 93-53 TaxID=1314785 RepID=A0A165FA15_9APHY|nr:V-snare-domain-containing protein [Laetiporus sulphureus 93-53]KZT08658.1 V-snare-domain-containing protein [Laetiporus sulphureus 93-53]